VPPTAAPATAPGVIAMAPLMPEATPGDVIGGIVWVGEEEAVTPGEGMLVGGAPSDPVGVPVSEGVTDSDGVGPAVDVGEGCVSAAEQLGVPVGVGDGVLLELGEAVGEAVPVGDGVLEEGAPAVPAGVPNVVGEAVGEVVGEGVVPEGEGEGIFHTPLTSVGHAAPEAPPLAHGGSATP
jgi:hypothetical protein